MTEIDNDKLLRDFFTENRQEIAGQGIPAAVSCHHLPDRRQSAGTHLERLRHGCGSRTFRLLRWTGSCMGNDSGGIHRHD